MKQKTNNTSIGATICDVAYITPNSNSIMPETTTEEDNQVRNTRMFHDIQDTDFFEFLRRETVNREKVDALMREYFDENGELRKKTVEGTNDVAGFDRDLYV